MQSAAVSPEIGDERGPAHMARSAQDPEAPLDKNKSENEGGKNTDSAASIAFRSDRESSMPQTSKSPAFQDQNKCESEVSNMSEATAMTAIHIDGMVEFVVPPGSHPGQNITVKLDGGHVVHAKIPRGFKPGMKFSVPYSRNENHADI